MKTPITNADIFARHPEGLLFDTDHEYASVARKLYNILKRTVFKENDLAMRNMAVNCALYLEDIASNIGVWESFVTLYRDLYGNDFPLYEIGKEYSLGDPNLQDVRFILWLSLVQVNDYVVLNPVMPHLIEASSMLFEYIDEVFDKVPVNEQFREYLYSSEIYDDFLLQRGILSWLYQDCYLTKAMDRVQMLKSKRDLIEPYLGEVDEDQLKYAAKCEVCFNCKCGPLALFAKDYLARMLELAGMKRQAKYVRDQEFSPMSFNKVLKCDEEIVEYRSCFGRRFKVQTSSYEDDVTVKLTEGAFSLGAFVKYRGKWLMNGVSSLGKFGPHFDAIERFQPKNRKSVEIVSRFIEANPSSKIMYARDTKELEKRYREIGLEPDDDKANKFKGARNIVLFITEDYGVNVILNVAPMIADPKNVAYDRSFAASGAAFLLIFNKNMVGEFIRYLIKEHWLPDAILKSAYNPEQCNELFQSNKDFFARLYRQNNY